MGCLNLAYGEALDVLLAPCSAAKHMWSVERGRQALVAPRLMSKVLTGSPPRARWPGLAGASALPALSSSQARLHASAAWELGPGSSPCSRDWASQARAAGRGRQRPSRWSGTAASEPAAARAAASLNGSQAQAEPSSGAGGGPGGSWDAATAAARLLKGLMFATLALSAVKILPTLGAPAALTFTVIGYRVTWK